MNQIVSLMRMILIHVLFIPVNAIGCPASGQDDEQMPNLLIIHTDEHNLGTLGCYWEILYVMLPRLFADPSAHRCSQACTRNIQGFRRMMCPCMMKLLHLILTLF